MALSNQIAAYDDCFEIFEAASATGSRVCFNTKGEAAHFMMRMHQARSLQRQETCRLYEPTDMRWGKSSYDRLTVRQPREDDNGFWWVYIEHASANIVAVEPLDAPQALQLEGPDNAE